MCCISYIFNKYIYNIYRPALCVTPQIKAEQLVWADKAGADATHI